MSALSPQTRRLGRPFSVATLTGASLLLIGAATASAAPVVWSTGAGGNGNSYELIANSSASWDDARADAQARGGDLATITSAGEQAFVESVLSGSGALTGGYWFGIREAAEGVYLNVDGTALTYTNYSPGEPNNANGIEDAGQILWTDPNLPLPDPAAVARSGMWNDAPAAGYVGGVDPTPADTFRAGYLVEIAADGNGDGDGDGDGGTTIPLPAAVYAFPLGVGLVGLFHRRMRR